MGVICSSFHLCNREAICGGKDLRVSMSLMDPASMVRSAGCNLRGSLHVQLLAHRVSGGVFGKIIDSTQGPDQCQLSPVAQELVMTMKPA